MFGPYAEFIIPSYLITALVFIGITAWTVVVYRSCRREMARLEEQGIRRRSRAAGTRNG